MKKKDNSTKLKVFHFGNNLKKKQKNEKNDDKKIIESYNTKVFNKYDNNNIGKKINLEMSSKSAKNNNLSLFSFISYNSSQLINKSLRTTKETESNQIKNSNQKLSEGKIKLKIINRNKMIQKSKNIGNINNNSYNNININEELNKFKNRIDNLLKVIENFEDNYINSEKPKKMKEEFDKLIKDKKYFQINNKNNILLKNNLNSTINIKIKKGNKQIYKTNNIFNSVNDFNKKKSKKYLKNDKNKNSINRKFKYSLLYNGDSSKIFLKIKDKKLKNYKTIKTQHYPSKSNEINEIEIMKEKEIKSIKKEKGNNITTKNKYINKDFYKTQKINKTNIKNK